jgi:Flp pilus assembly protein TadB
LRGWLEHSAGILAQPTEVTAVTLYAQPIAQLATVALPVIVQMAIETYLTLILLGLTLILLALIAPLFVWMFARKRKNKSSSEQLESASAA